MTAYEAQLLQFARQDDQAPTVADLSSLVPLHSALLFRVAHSVLRNRTEAEDVVQDTFLRVLQHRQDLAGIRDVRVWLVRIAWRLALDRRRRSRPQQMDEAFTAQLAACSVPADRVLAETQKMAAVLTAIDALPAPERHAILLSAMEDLQTSEIAAILGRTESATRALLSRARARLRQRLESTAAKGKR